MKLVLRPPVFRRHRRNDAPVKVHRDDHDEERDGNAELAHPIPRPPLPHPSAISAVITSTLRRRDTELHRLLRPHATSSLTSLQSDGGRPTVAERVSDLIRRDPSSTSTRDGKGRTALHVACSDLRRQASSPDVVEELLASNPDAALWADRKGRTPLHVACKSGCGEDVLSALLKSSVRPCTMVDGAGRTPAHRAASCLPSMTFGTLNVLLKADPGAVLIEDAHGETPFSVFCAQFRRCARLAQHAAIVTGKPDLLDSRALLEKAVPFVNAMERCRRAELKEEDCPANGGAGEGDGHDDRFDLGDGGMRPSWRCMLHRTIHAIALSGVTRTLRGLTDAKHLLLSVLSFTRLQICLTDPYGDLPIHLASLLPRLNNVTPGERLWFQSSDCNFLERLVSAYPESASERGSGGKLPFQIMIENGATWEGGAGAALRANPLSLRGVDMECELMPMVLERAGTSGEPVCLAVMFDALRERPELIVGQ